jgi:ribosome maturation factor RimP
MHGGSRHGSLHPAKASQAKASSRGVRPRAAESSPAPDSDRLVRLLEPVIAALNLDLESLRVTAAGRRRQLRVVVDADGGVSLDDIALASRELSIRLDGAAEMGDLPYTLEVSSPGVDRPLTQPRHWRRAIGRLVVAQLQSEARDNEGGNVVGMAEGRIVSCGDRGVTLECDGVSCEYGYAELGPGRVQVEFGHFDAGDDDELGEED